MTFCKRLDAIMGGQSQARLLRSQAHLESMDVVFDFKFGHVNFNLLGLFKGPNTRRPDLAKFQMNLSLFYELGNLLEEDWCCAAISLALRHQTAVPSFYSFIRKCNLGF